jgi:Peptidase family M28
MPLTIRRRLVDRVRQLRKIAYAVCVVLAVLASGVVFLSISAPTSTVEVSIGPTFFDSGRAFRLAGNIVDLSRERSLGSEGAARVATWMEQKLAAFGTTGGSNPTLKMSSFQAPLGDRQVTLQNVSLVLQGSAEQAILIAAPRDTPAVVKVDPLAYSSGTAVLMELAQVFASRPHQKTLIFLSTEDATGGGLGIDYYLDHSDLKSKISAVLSFQGLGKERTKALLAGVTAPQSTTPGWYVQLTGQVLQKAGLPLRVPGLVSQAADHALSLSTGDQAAGLSRGVASLRLYDETGGSPTAAGLATQGAAIERLIMSLDAEPQIPSDPGTGLVLASGRYLTSRAVSMLATLMLLPAIAALLIWLFSSRISPRGALMHLRNLMSFALPLALVFVLAYLLARWGLIPLYHNQVPASLGPATEPRVGPTLILILLGGAFFLISRHLLGYLRPRESRAATEMTRLCVGFVSLVFGLALMLSRSPFLLLPCLALAWAWPLATCFAEPVHSSVLWRHRFLSNAPVLLIGLIVPILLYGYLASGNHIGWLNAWWYVLVQTVSGAYGVRGPAAIVFITAGFLVLLGVRRMRVVPIETLEVMDELSMLEPPAPRGRRKPRQPATKPLSPWR